jgi:hypothetical protein
MKRRSFLTTFAALPLLGSVPPYFPAPLLRVPKIISFKCTTNFELSPILTSGKLEMLEDINEPPKVELAVSYDDGSVRNFICDNKKWIYETRDHEHEVIIDGDTITYYYPMNITEEDSKLTCACIFKNVKEVYENG